MISYNNIILTLDPSQWLRSVCKESCEIRKNSMQCAADNSIIIRLNISDGLSIKFPLHTYVSRGCQECHNFSEVIITCKPFMVTCVNDETITPTSSPSTKSTGLSLYFLSVSFSLSYYNKYSV